MGKDRWLGLALVLALATGCGDDDGSGPSDGGGMARVDGGGSSGSDGGGASDSDGGGASGRDAGGGSGGTDGGAPPATGCAPLPPATGTIVTVGPSRASELPSIVRNAAPGTTILLEDGTYRMSGDEASRRIQVTSPGITIRSASGNAEAVVIDGEYRTAEILTIHADDVTIAELTITRAIDHGVHVFPYEADDVTGTRLYRVRIVDCGEQLVKVNPNGARTAFVDDGVLECSYLELTDAGRPHIERSTGGCYTGGIDAHSARGWVVRDNVFVGIYCAGERLAEHAVHFWSASRDTLVERNRIVDCARGIGFGLVESGATRSYPDDPYPGLYVGHYDGIIRNNVIVARIPWYDTGIELAQARGTRVHHNTIVETDGTTGRFSSIDARFPNTRVEIRNNLVRRLTVRNDATSIADHNLENVPLDYFVDAEGGDVHLTASASQAIDRGVALDDAGSDIDGEPHDRGAAPDLGADER